MIESYGAKYTALLSLANATDCVIPSGFAIPLYCSLDEVTDKQWESLLASIQKVGPLVAIRSSAVMDPDTLDGYASLFPSFTRVSTADTEHVKQCIQAVHRKGSVATIVQRMVEAKVSGKAFSRDPDRGDCSLVMTGTVDLEYHLVNRDTLEVGLLKQEPGYAQKRVAREVLKIEKHFGYPVDVDWAMDADGQLYILRVRPIKQQNIDRGDT